MARGKYPKAIRAHYLIDVNSDAVPPLVTETDITLQGQRIKDDDSQLHTKPIRL
ncbi:MAG: hypothetical protein ABIT08_08305 [Bacteroidia bacterium]